MQNGKGSKPRPIASYANYVSNWEEIAWEYKEEDHKISDEQTEDSNQEELKQTGD